MKHNSARGANTMEFPIAGKFARGVNTSRAHAAHQGAIMQFNGLTLKGPIGNFCCGYGLPSLRRKY